MWYNVRGQVRSVVALENNDQVIVSYDQWNTAFVTFKLVNAMRGVVTSTSNDLIFRDFHIKDFAMNIRKVCGLPSNYELPQYTFNAYVRVINAMKPLLGKKFSELGEIVLEIESEIVSFLLNLVIQAEQALQKQSPKTIDIWEQEIRRIPRLGPNEARRGFHKFPNARRNRPRYLRWYAIGV